MVPQPNAKLKLLLELSLRLQQVGSGPKFIILVVVVDKLLLLFRGRRLLQLCVIDPKSIAAELVDHTQI